MAAEVAPVRVADAPILVGKIRGVHGVRGWFRVISHTRPRENLLEYDPWMVRGREGWVTCHVLESGSSGGGLTVLLDLARDRTAAREWIGSDIAVRRGQFPELPPGQYYWSDLVGLCVRNRAGTEFGRVTGLLETGANDVLEVEGPAGRILVPYVLGRIVEQVDFGARVIRVDWDPEYQ